MAGIVHAKVSTVADSSTATEVRTTSNWNADHTIDSTVILSSNPTPLQFVAGALNTTSTTGAREFDGTCFYQTAIDNTRQVVVAPQVINTTASRLLSTSTAAQQMFDASANGRVSVGPGTYAFECAGFITGMSTSSHSVGWGLAGTAAVGQYQWKYMAWFRGAGSTVLTNGVPFHVSTLLASTALLAATTVANFVFNTDGEIVVNTSGTIVPELRIPANNATASTLQKDAYFRIWPLGSSVFSSVGNWS
jgi:hypothetical protein